MRKIIFLSTIILASAIFISSVSAETFTKDLKFGMQADQDIRLLQEFLKSENLYTGPVTGNFFNLTQKAVIDFQKREGIVPASGYLGPKTRAKINISPIQKDVSIGLNQPTSFKLQSTETPTSISIQKIETNPSALQTQLNSLLEQVKILQQQVQAQQSINPQNLTVQQGQSMYIPVSTPQPTIQNPPPSQPQTPTSSTRPFGTVVPGNIIIL